MRIYERAYAKINLYLDVTVNCQVLFLYLKAEGNTNNYHETRRIIRIHSRCPVKNTEKQA